MCSDPAERLIELEEAGIGYEPEHHPVLDQLFQQRWGKPEGLPLKKCRRNHSTALATQGQGVLAAKSAMQAEYSSSVTVKN